MTSGAPPGLDDVFPLTALQAGMVYHTLRAPESGAFVVQYACSLPADTDLAELERSWRDATHAYPALRTVVLWEGLDRPLQAIRTPAATNDVALQIVEAEAGQAWRTWLTRDRLRGFAFDGSPLWRISVVQEQDRLRFCWTFHHVILDGWSAVRILEEAFSNALGRSVPSAPTQPPTPSFRDFVGWTSQQTWDQEEAFWRARLAGFTERTPLGDGGPGTGTHEPEGAAVRHRVERALSPDLWNRVRAWTADERVTPAAFMHGVYALSLSQVAGTEDVLYGATLSGRTQGPPGVEQMIGLLINTVPVRVTARRAQSPGDFVRGLQEELLAVAEVAQTPLPALKGWMDPGIEGLPFESALVYEGVPRQRSSLGVEDEEFHDQSDLPLAVLVHPGSDDTPTRWIALFDPTRLAASAIEAWFDRMTHILEAFVDGASSLGAALPGLSAEVQDQMHPWNGEVGDARDVIERWLAHAESDGIAVMSTEAGSPAWTHAQLAEQVRRAAEEYRAAGSAGRLVAVSAAPKPETLARFLGALEADSPYLPLDPHQPPARLEAVLADAGVSGWWEATGYRALDPAASQTSAAPEVDPGMAYLMYTSGSTGTPKGVWVDRANLAWSTAARDVVHARAPARFLVVSPLHFDSSVVGLYWTLIHGGTVVLADDATVRDPHRLAAALRDRAITHILCLPSLWRWVLPALRPEDVPNLDTVIVAGEACPPDLAAEHLNHLPEVALFNEYGPTEGTVWATVEKVNAKDAKDVVPIGRAAPGARIHVLDPWQQPVPTGVTGEVWVGGPGVARGYHGRPEETASRFVQDPFQGGNAARMYRTGDRAHVREDGRLVYVGRADGQLKVRGVRVEPGEVERALQRHPDVTQAVVVGLGDGDRTDRLQACVASSSLDPEAPEWSAFLAEHLPEALRPRRTLVLSELPRGRTGKVDRNAVSRLLTAERPEPTRADSPSRALTSTETRLAALWSKVLDTHPIHPDDHFFEVGGHSLLAIQLLGLIRRDFGVELAMETLVTDARLEQMAAEVDRLTLVAANVEREVVEF